MLRVYNIPIYRYSNYVLMYKEYDEVNICPGSLPSSFDFARSQTLRIIIIVVLNITVGIITTLTDNNNTYVNR